MLVDEHCINIIEHLILFGIPLSTCSTYKSKSILFFFLGIVGPLVILGTVIDGAYRTMALDQEQ